MTQVLFYSQLSRLFSSTGIVSVKNVRQLQYCRSVANEKQQTATYQQTDVACF